jgi:hypothetical protein
VVIGGFRMWSGYCPASEDGALREVTQLCGLTLGHQGGVKEDLGRAFAGAAAHKPVRDRQGLRLVSGGRHGHS